MGMGCRPSKQNSDKIISAAFVNSHDRQVIGTFLPLRDKSALFADRNTTTVKEAHVQQGVCRGVKTSPDACTYDTSQFNDFSTATATYRQVGGDGTERITVRLSTDGTTLEIEHIEQTLFEEVKAEDNSAVRLIQRSASAPDLLRHQPITSRHEVDNHTVIRNRVRPVQCKPSMSKLVEMPRLESMNEQVVMRQGQRTRQLYNDRCISAPYSSHIGETLRAMLSQKDTKNVRNLPNDDVLPSCSDSNTDDNGIERASTESKKAPLAEFDDKSDEASEVTNMRSDAKSRFVAYCADNNDAVYTAHALENESNSDDAMPKYFYADDDEVVSQYDDTTTQSDDSCGDDQMLGDRHNSMTSDYDCDGIPDNLCDPSEKKKYDYCASSHRNHPNTPVHDRVGVNCDSAIFCCDLSNFPNPNDSDHVMTDEKISYDLESRHFETHNDCAPPNNTPINHNACFVTDLLSNFALDVDALSNVDSEKIDSKPTLNEACRNATALNLSTEAHVLVDDCICQTNFDR